ncbi:flagellar basal body P-ring formation chaperone FlgA [Vibrio sp. SS-MA-C1-2]|uniref:flagellar basal body P-ring formation chaperone FlgA n=1 Tax=Vibrio sp. SS-MA-C1-2 TaxID=2908646 RepID=UPI001F3EA105|nr:flagellar basal body P-ring formation chaperone FlgA [Vibrio sp. SS-MA-C1-2]UJF18043.1 flagellar basal body P-ring formation chaperone FlgA [Vibrio sp. SS-MA-C1-2]
MTLFKIKVKATKQAISSNRVLFALLLVVNSSTLFAAETASYEQIIEQNINDSEVITLKQRIQARTEKIISFHYPINIDENYDINYKFPTALNTLICQSPKIKMPKEMIGKNRWQVSCITPEWNVKYIVNARFTTKVVTAKLPIKKGELLNNENTQLVETKIYNSQQQFYRNLKPVMNRKVRRSLRVGTMIQPRYLYIDYDITKGEIINIKLQRRNITIVTEGVSLQNGLLGDEIKVKNSQSGEVVHGRVIDSQTILIN